MSRQTKESTMDANGWRPIESVVFRNGARVLVYVPSDYGAEIGHFMAGKWIGTHGYEIHPTHYQPLPPPPALEVKPSERSVSR